MANQLIPFDFEEQSVRAYCDESGNSWFVARDVALALGYTNPQDAVQNHCKAVKILKCSESLLLGVPPRGLLVIPESDVWRLILRSRLPKAEVLEKWLMEDVLPTLRKTGSYTMPTPKPEIPEPPQPKAIEPAPERLPREMPDMELPESALNLRPSMRMRLWQDALQSARLEGAGIAYAVDCFVKLCTVMAKQPKPKESPFRDEVKQFIATRCRFTPGTNTRASDLYEAFRGWRRKHGKGHMPSQKIFGEAMGLHYEKYQSNGQWYRDVSLVNSPAS